VLGTGEPRYEEGLRRLAAQFPEKVGVRIAFDEPLAHQMEAGADLFLMPSRYEPCGLNQMYSLKYGTIPVVRATGGLKDTVQEYDPERETGNGFLFGSYEAAALVNAVDRALGLFRSKRSWAALIHNAMNADFSWARSAQAYAELYRQLLPAG